MNDSGKAAIVVPTGFLTVKNGIGKTIREYLIDEEMVRGVVSMPSNIFATTGTNVSVLFIDKESKGKDVILIDDMIDTAGTMVKAAAAFKQKGATSVIALGTHAVFSGPAYERIQDSAIDEVIVTDTIPMHQKCSKIKVLSVAPLFAEVIKRINKDESVNSLFV